MKNYKRLLAFALSASMVFSMTACGSKDDDDDKKSKDDGTVAVEDVDSIYDALALADQYTKGSYKMTLSADVDIDGTKESVDMSIAGKMNGQDASLGAEIDFNLDGEKATMKFDDIFIVADGVAYVDLDAIVSAVSDEKTKFGCFGIPMPDVEEIEVSKDMQKITEKFYKAVFDAADVEQDGKTFTATFTDADDYYAAAENIVSFFSDNASAIEDSIKGAFENSTSFDYKEYAKSLVDYYAEDIKGIGELAGEEITDDMIDEIKDQIDELEEDDIEDMADIDLDLKSAADELEDLFKEVSKEDFEAIFNDEEVEAKTTFVVTADEDKYEIGVDFTVKAADQGSVTIAYKFEFNVDEETIVAPSKASSIMDIYNYAMDNQEMLMNVLEDVQEWASSFDSVLGVDDDYDYDWDDDDYDYDWDDDDYDFDWDDDDYDFDWDDDDYDFDWDDDNYDFDWDDDNYDFDWDDSSVEAE